MSSKVAAMSEDYAIKIDKVCKTYRLYKRNSDRIRETFHPLRKQYHHPFTALDQVSFSIKRGESVGIIGKNGRAKGKWTWGQFCPFIPGPDFPKLITKAKKEGTIK